MSEFIEEPGPGERTIEGVSSLKCERHVEGGEIQMDCEVRTHDMWPPSDEPIFIENVSRASVYSGSEEEVHNGAKTTRMRMKDGNVNCRVRKIGAVEGFPARYNMNCGVGFGD